MAPCRTDRSPAASRAEERSTAAPLARIHRPTHHTPSRPADAFPAAATRDSNASGNREADRAASTCSQPRCAAKRSSLCWNARSLASLPLRSTVPASVSCLSRLLSLRKRIQSEKEGQREVSDRLGTREALCRDWGRLISTINAFNNQRTS